MTVERDLVNINIRPMVHADLDQVHHIDRISFSSPWSKSSFEFELDRNPCSRSWVVEITIDNSESQLIGVIVLWVVEDEGHIGTIAVHPDFRQQGIASSLVTYALENIQREGVNIVFLEVRRTNIAAQVLYKKFGFHKTGVRAKYYADNQEDALVFTLFDIQSKEIINLSNLRDE
ncbi:MAG: ribosomal protein S18-alanine N-acetyltransferase [Anaerolineaceae bacterium]|nr:ribosomal protein S18-alanine N-acetyltransferase [Anaerolineaceae bacterium]